MNWREFGKYVGCQPLGNSAGTSQGRKREGRRRRRWRNIESLECRQLLSAEASSAPWAELDRVGTPPVGAIHLGDAFVCRLPVDFAASGSSANANLTAAASAATVTIADSLFAEPAIVIVPTAPTLTSATFAPVEPLGSLIERAVTSSDITVAGEVDQISMDLDAGQTVSVVIRPLGGLRPTIDLIGPGGGPALASVTAAAVGQNALLQTVPATVAGVYLLDVRGAAATTGSYSIEILLNAAIETESATGAANDSFATAQPLDASFLVLGGTPIAGTRGAVVAQREPDLIEPFEFPLSAAEWTTSSSAAGGIVAISSEFGAAEGKSALIMGRQVSGGLTRNEATWKVDLSGVSAAQLTFYHQDFTDEEQSLDPTFTNFFNGDGVSISTNGTNWFRLMDATNVAAGVWQQVTFNLVAFATTHGIALDSDVYLRFQQYDNTGLSGPGPPSDGRGYDEIQIVTTPANTTTDWYSFELADGESASISVNESGEDFAGSLRIYDAAANLLASADEAAELAYVLRNFRDLTNNSVLDRYYLELDQPATNYTLVVTRNADFDREQNDSQSNAQRLDAVAQALGFVSNQGVGSLEIQSTFAGPSYTGFIPPDPTLAVGPTTVVSLVNTTLAIHDKATGTPLFEQSISGGAGFFGTVDATTTVFDPWVIFDDDSQRFFIVGIDIVNENEANLYLAVSTTSSPTHGSMWHKYQLAFVHDPESLGLGLGNHFADYEKLGVNDDALFVSGNYFPIQSGTGIYAGITAIEKAPLLNGGPANILFQDFFSGLSVFPLTQYDSDGAQYFAEALSGNQIRIHSVTDVLTSPQRHTYDLTVPAYADVVTVPQLGTSAKLDAINPRVMTGVWRDGSAWFAHAVTDPALGDGENVVRWYEVATNDFPTANPVLTQSGNVDPGPGVHAFMPAISVDDAAGMAIGFSVGGAAMYAGAAISGRTASMPAGQTLPVQTFAAGKGPYSLSDGSGRVRWGDYSGLAIDPSDNRTFWVFNEYATSLNHWATQIASFVVSPQPESDFYEISVNVGDNLTIETLTPFDGVANLANTLDPRLRLYDPLGAMVADDDNGAVDGRNSSLNHLTTQSGVYRLEVVPQQDEGAYFVSVVGATGSNAAPVVIDTNPDDGQLLNVFPSSYEVRFSEGIAAASVQPADLVINGLPATAATVIGSTVQFTINPAANSGAGTYVVQMAAGAVQDLQGIPLAAGLNASFVLDVSGPRITSTSWNANPLPSNRVLTPGTLVFTAAFNEDLFVASSPRRGPLTPGSDDITLRDLDTSAVISENSVGYSPLTDLLTAQYNSLVEGNYRLTMDSAPGAFADNAGNLLDGEPNLANPDGTVTGNGTAGGSYFVDFQVDIAEVPLQTLTRVEPLGGLVATSFDNDGFVNNATDADAFTFIGQVGQKVAARVTIDGTVIATLELRNAANTVIASVTGVDPGDDLLLPPTLLNATETYRLRLVATGVTRYSLDVVLNAIAESFVGDVADGSELSLDATQLTIGSAGASGRWAVVGTAHDALGFVKYQDPSKWVEIAGNGTPLNPDDDEEIVIETTVGNELIPAGYITIGDNGGVIAGLGTSVFFVNLPLPAPDIGRGIFPYWDDLDGPEGNVYWREQQVGGINTLIVQWDDLPHYEAIGSATFELQLFQSGPVLARFAYEDVDFGNPLYDQGASATIGYQHSGLLGYEYSFGGADLSVPIPPTGSVANGDVIDLQRVADVDEYTLDLSAHVGQEIDVVLSGIGGLDFSAETLELLDPNGLVVATGTSQPLGATVTNYDLGITDFLITSVGNHIYTVRVSSMTRGEYGLVVTQAAAFETEPNNTAVGPLRQLNTTAIGFIGATDTPDNYLLSMQAGETLVAKVTRLFPTATGLPVSQLIGLLQVYSSSGALLVTDFALGASRDLRVTLVSPTAQLVRIVVGALSGSSGEYLMETARFTTDFGDAPSAYPTLIAANGAAHAATGPQLGASRDAEIDGLVTVDALGDDQSGSDDEDGVTLGSVIVGEVNASLTVDVQNTATIAFLSAWVDWNGDGFWAATERLWGGLALTLGSHALSFTVPATASVGTRIARFRLASTAILTSYGPSGDGEVEDYGVLVVPQPPFILVPDQDTALDDGVSATGNVLANDSDPYGGPPMSVSNPGVYAGAYGQLTLAANGDYSYLVSDESIDDGFSGSDVFGIDVTDGIATLSTTLTINVQGQNDPPVLTSGTSLSLLENQSLVGSVTASDLDATDNLSFALGAGGADTSLFHVDPSTGALSFLAPPDFENPLDANTDNVYQVEVTVTDGTVVLGQSLSVQVGNAAEVAGRFVFYNRAPGSLFGSTGNPDDAIDMSKSALTPGQTTTFDNYTNFVRGLNGLVIDLQGPIGLISRTDFQFDVWDGVAAGGFIPSTAIATVTVFPGGGSGGANRVKIEFDDGVIRNTWLRVTMLANSNTNLAANDVFFFGNAVADFDVGNLGANVRVNASDTAAVRLNQSIGINSVDIESKFDVNKDGRVNASDTSLVRTNQAPQLIRHFTAP